MDSFLLYQDEKYFDEAKKLASRFSEKGETFSQILCLNTLNLSAIKWEKVDFICLFLPNIDIASLEEICLHFVGYPVKIQMITSLETTPPSPPPPPSLEDFCFQEDLLSQEFDLSHYNQKKVVVIGAGGTIGAKLVEKLLLVGAEVIAIGRSENSIYLLWEKLAHFPRFQCFIANILDTSLTQNLLKKINPHFIFHTAAHKHVLFMEKQPLEAANNNIIGTYHLLKACETLPLLEKFVLISTDKATEPLSVMGMTKNISERLVLDGSFSFQRAVMRIGNVVASRGSLIPTIAQRIANQQIIEITHPKMRRFFFNQSDIIKGILFSGLQHQGLFSLYREDDSSIFSIILSFLEFMKTPLSQVSFRFTGARKGEKLQEILLPKNKKVNFMSKQIFEIMKSKEDFLNQDDIYSLIEELESLIHRGDEKESLDFLKKWILV